jgi:hypothetical protein
MTTILVQKRGVDWYRHQGRLIRILSKSTAGYLIQVSTHKL